MMSRTLTAIGLLFLVVSLAWVLWGGSEVGGSPSSDETDPSPRVDKEVVFEDDGSRDEIKRRQGSEAGGGELERRKVRVLPESAGAPVEGARVFLLLQVGIGQPSSASLENEEWYRLLGSTDEQGWLALADRVDGVLFASKSQVVSRPARVNSDGNYTVRLRECSGVTVRLLQSGLPINGVEVMLQELSTSQGGWARRASTDGDGEAAFLEVPSGRFAASTSSEFGTAYAWLTVDGEAQRVELDVLPGRTLQVHLESKATGEAVLGARVQIKTPLICSKWEEVAPGVFRAGPIPSDLTVWVLEVSAPSFARDQFQVHVEPGVGESRHTLSLVAGQKVVGRLVDPEGNGIEGAAVSISGFRWDGQSRDRARVQVSDTANSEQGGKFEFLLPRNLTLESLVAIVPGAGACVRDLRGLSLDGPLDLGDCVVTRFAELAVSVVDLDGGNPSETLRVVVAPTGVAGGRELRHEVLVSAERHRFEVDGLPSSLVSVSCLRDNIVIAQERIDLSGGLESVEIRVPASDQLNLQLCDVGKASLSGAVRVEVNGSVWDEVQLVEGVARLRDLPEGVDLKLIWLGQGQRAEIAISRAGRSAQSYQLTKEGVFHRIPWVGD